MAYKPRDVLSPRSISWSRLSGAVRMGLEQRQCRRLGGVLRSAPPVHIHVPSTATSATRFDERPRPTMPTRRCSADRRLATVVHDAGSADPRRQEHRRWDGQRALRRSPCPACQQSRVNQLSPSATASRRPIESAAPARASGLTGAVTARSTDPCSAGLFLYLGGTFRHGDGSSVRCGYAA